MNTFYNKISGQSVERLAALSDGIFAVAMTLLVLDLHVPAGTPDNQKDLLLAVEKLCPDLLVYVMSFMTLGIFWVGQQTQLHHLKRSTRGLTWLNLAYLFGVTLLPFTTHLLVEFTDQRVALLIYWAMVFFLGAMLYAAGACIQRAGLADTPSALKVQAEVCHRIVIAQAFYALGAALCYFSTYLSIGFIVLVQLNYVLAPTEWKWGARPKND